MSARRQVCRQLKDTIPNVHQNQVDIIIMMIRPLCALINRLAAFCASRRRRRTQHSGQIGITSQLMRLSCERASEHAR